MAFTKVVGAGIHTLSNIASHNINSSGIITATKFVGPIEGNITAVDGVFSGNVSIAKTLTYEDVKNVDSVGVGTFREGVFIPDNKKLEIGNASGSGDLQLYHSPSDNNNSFIKHQGSGALKIAADHFRFRNAADNSNILNGLSGDKVTLYFAGNEKLSTTSDGIEVPGAIRHLNDTDTKLNFHDDDKFRIELGGLQYAFSGRKSTSGSAHAKWGINVATPQAALDINEVYNHQGLIRVTNGNQNSGYYHQLEMSGTNNIFTLWRHFDGSSFNNTHIHGSTRHAWYIGGNEKVRVHSNGSVGIGTISPTALLHLHKASGDTIQKIESSNGAASLELRHTNGYGYIRYLQDGAEIFRAGQIAQFTSYSIYNPSSSLPYQLCVEGNGEVGINTHNPGDTLHLLRNNANHGIRLQRAGTNPGSAYVQVHSNGVLSLQGGNNVHYVSGGSQQHIWYQAGTERGRFDTSGRLLVGRTTGNSANLLVQSGAQVFAGANNGNSSCLTLDYNTATGSGRIMGHASSGGSLEFLTNASGAGVTPKLYISSSGLVGIGTVSPAVMHHLYSASGGLYTRFEAPQGQVNFGNSNGAGVIHVTSTSQPLRVLVNGTNERLRITSDGKVGINQTVPTCQLQIDSGSSGAGTVTHLELNHKGNDTNDAVKLNFARAGGDIGSIVLEKVASNNTTDFIFNTRSYNTVSESMRITGAGNIKLPDNAKIELGGAQTGSGDLQIYHDSSANFNNIQSLAGSNLRMRQQGNGAGLYLSATHIYLQNHNNNETYLHAQNNGSVSLYHNNLIRAYTAADGFALSRVNTFPNPNNTGSEITGAMLDIGGNLHLEERYPAGAYSDRQDLVFRFNTGYGQGFTDKIRFTSGGKIELQVDGGGIRFPNTQTPTNSMTSRVGISSEMRYYESGEFVPGLSSTVLNGLQIPAFTDASYTRRIGRYVRVGNLVFLNIEILMANSVTYNAGNTSTAPVCITGIPFSFQYANRWASTGHPDYYPCAISYSSTGLSNDTLYATLQRNYNAQPRIEITKPGANGSRQYNSTNFGEVFPANGHIIVSCTYAIDINNADY